MKIRDQKRLSESKSSLEEYHYFEYWYWFEYDDLFEFECSDYNNTIIDEPDYDFLDFSIFPNSRMIDNDSYRTEGYLRDKKLDKLFNI